MKNLSHNDFDGFNNGYSKRGILNALVSERYILETKWDRQIRNFRRGCIIVFITLVFILSSFIAGKWLAWDTGYEFAIKQIYHSNSKQTELNKHEAYKNIGIQEDIR